MANPTPQTAAATWRAFRVRYTSRPFAPRTAASLLFGKKNQKLRAIADPGAGFPGISMSGDFFGLAKCPNQYPFTLPRCSSWRLPSLNAMCMGDFPYNPLTCNS